MFCAYQHYFIAVNYIASFIYSYQSVRVSVIGKTNVSLVINYSSLKISLLLGSNDSHASVS